MILSPRSLGRRQGEVGVIVGVDVVLVVFSVSVGVVLVLVVLVLLLRVLLGAPQRTIIRDPIVEGDVLLRGVVGRQFVLTG